MADPTKISFNPDQILSEYDPKGSLGAYYQVLLSENEMVNLVSRETTKSDLKFLAADSLLPLSYIETQDFNNYLDIGSGGGFPAIPILLTKNVNQARLFERRSKKANALGNIVSSLKINGTTSQAENFEDHAFNVKFDLITLRLVTLTERILKKISNLMSGNSVFIYYSTSPFSLEKFKLNSKSYTYQSGSSDRFKSFTIITKK